MGAESEAAELNQSSGATSPEDGEALLDAARYGDLEDLMNLATAGVLLGSKDEQGRTPLHMATANGHLDIVDWMLMPLTWRRTRHYIGLASMVTYSHERTPIDEAVSRGKMEVIDAINTVTAQLELALTAVS